MDGQTAERLFAAIVSYVEERGGYVTKTKLLKLLYIFDVEYFRARRQTYTGFAWKFYPRGTPKTGHRWTLQNRPTR